MAIQSFQLDPAAGGVSQAEFDSHTHGYRRLDQIGIDDVTNYSSPNRATVTDDAEVSIGEQARARAVGVTVSTQQTAVPT
jgi:hypothetical protein